MDPITGRSFFSKKRVRFDQDRMPRELTFSCYKRLPLLNRERTRHWFVEALRDAREAWPVDLWAWVIMPEHVHLLVAPREPGVEVGRFQSVVKEKTARRAIAWLEENHPAFLTRLTVREGSRMRRRFWQPGGGYDRNINSLDTLYGMIEYSHMNPVRRGLGVVERAVVRWHSTGAP